MNRPIPLFFIAAWFLLVFSTLPQRYQVIFAPLVGEENIPLLLLIAFAITVFIVFKFIQCEKIFVNIVFWWICIWVSYQVIQFAWVAIQYWEQAQIHPLRFTGLFIHIACIIYLVMPSTRKKISVARANIEAEQMRKFQLKQMNKP